MCGQEGEEAGEEMMKEERRDVRLNPGFWEVIWLFICSVDFNSNRLLHIVLHDCLEIENAGEKKIFKGMRLNSFFIWKCNYKAFKRLHCPDRLSLWNHAQISKCSLVQILPEPANASSAPAERERERKHQIDCAGPWGAPSILCSFTLVLWVSTKRYYSRAVGSVDSYCRTRTRIQTKTLEGSRELRQTTTLCALYKNILLFL